MANEINYCNLENSKIAEGVEKVANAVAKTFGPKGSCVAIESSFGVPDITRDGATVAKAISLKDKVEDMGAQLVKKAAQSTEEQAGDGTSTTTILINEMVKQAKDQVKSKSNLNDVKKGMEAACKTVIDSIKTTSIPVNGDYDKVHKVATISANNDPEIGDLIVDCMKQVGMDGIVTAENSKSIETKIEVTSGFKIDRGWANPNFITDPKSGKSVLENPAIAVIGEKLSSIPQIQNLFQAYVAAEPGKPILVICDDIDDSVLTFFIYNNLNGALKSCVIKGVDFGDNRKNIMQDIATYTGATYVCPEMQTTTATSGPEILGTASKVVISKDSCIVYEGQGDPQTIKTRLDILKERSIDPDITKYDKDKFEHRIAALSGGVGIIKVGGASEAEQTNKKATIEDAILASKSAISEGVVPGSGSVYLRASMIPGASDNSDWNIGYNIVMNALKSITKIIASNAGESGDVVLNNISEHISDPNYGFNAKTNQYGDLLEMGVLDSAKVLRISLENAVSTAAMVILTSCTITNISEDDDHCSCGCCHK